MTVHPDSRLMSAQHDPRTTDTSPHPIGPAVRFRGEGVKAVELFNRRRDRKRAWDELSEIDRAVLLEAVRQRRDAQEQRRSIQAGLDASRQLR